MCMHARVWCVCVCVCVCVCECVCARAHVHMHDERHLARSLAVDFGLEVELQETTVFAVDLQKTRRILFVFVVGDVKPFNGAQWD